MAPKVVVYYTDAKGYTPALEFLLGLPQDDQRKAFAYVSYLEERGEVLRRPIAEYLGGKLYELRPKQVRILYAFVGKGTAVIPHAFRKKTGPVPLAKQHLARTRLPPLLRRDERRG